MFRGLWIRSRNIFAYNLITLIPSGTVELSSGKDLATVSTPFFAGQPSPAPLVTGRLFQVHFSQKQTLRRCTQVTVEYMNQLAKVNRQEHDMVGGGINVEEARVVGRPFFSGIARGIGIEQSAAVPVGHRPPS
jgi:hypothetical protein